ncbi:MAG: hypothetical protein KJO48_02640 [Ignavibacteria bacterium]|nr:hypothetical protein [Ignavibacteria bacterium]
MRFFNIICMLVLFQFCSHSIDTNTTHYVDKNASGSNDGASWTNAWESLSDIEWDQIQPGDVLYISGGTDSTVYNEQLNIQASGSAVNLITIRNSYEANHNGRVIIDLVDFSEDGIIIGTSASANPDYIYIKGLEIRRGDHGVHIRYACEVITLDSLIITNNYRRGLRFAGDSNPCCQTLPGYAADNLLLMNSIIITPNDLDSETDVMYLQHASNIIIKNNFLHCRNKSPVNNHSDVIQSNAIRNLKVFNNVMISDSNAQGMPQITGAWDIPGDGVIDSVIIYNNFMYGGGLWYGVDAPWVAGLNPAWANRYPHDTPPTFIAHNTIITHGPTVAAVHVQVPGVLFINNILAQFGDGLAVGDWLPNFRTSPTTYADSTRHNLIWTEWPGNSNRLFQGYVSGNGITGQCYDWNTWENTYGGTGVGENPLLVSPIGSIPSDEQGNITGELQSNSPAINAGEDIQALIESIGLPWEDVDGNARNESPDSVTIGAYNPPWLR